MKSTTTITNNQNPPTGTAKTCSPYGIMTIPFMRGSCVVSMGNAKSTNIPAVRDSASQKNARRANSCVAGLPSILSDSAAKRMLTAMRPPVLAIASICIPDRRSSSALGCRVVVLAVAFFTSYRDRQCTAKRTKKTAMSRLFQPFIQCASVWRVAYAKNPNSSVLLNGNVLAPTESSTARCLRSALCTCFG